MDLLHRASDTISNNTRPSRKRSNVPSDENNLLKSSHSHRSNPSYYRQNNTSYSRQNNILYSHQSSPSYSHQNRKKPRQDRKNSQKRSRSHLLSDPSEELIHSLSGLNISMIPDGKRRHFNPSPQTSMDECMKYLSDWHQDVYSKITRRDHTVSPLLLRAYLMNKVQNINVPNDVHQCCQQLANLLQEE